MKRLPGAAVCWDRLVAGAALMLVVVSGCHSLRPFAPVNDPPDKAEAAGPRIPTPGKSTFTLTQFVFHADFELKRDEPIFAELAELRKTLQHDLQLPASGTPIHIYLFENRERYDQFMATKYPDLPRRRAFFVAQPRAVGAAEDLLVYTFWGERIREDLRHELTHAVLHSVLKDVPLWLDEGLAEYYELPPEWQGVNPAHLDQFQNPGNTPFVPDLVHLEGLNQVQQMTPAEYREGWAWVHLMMHTSPGTKEILIAYLRQLRSNPNPGPLKPRLDAVLPDMNAKLLAHLSLLDTHRPIIRTAGERGTSVP